MKGHSYFGYKFLFFIALVVAIANAGARGHDEDFTFDNPDPAPDSPAVDTSKRLRFPIYDHTGVPGERVPASIDLDAPSNVNRSVEYDPEEGRYYFTEKIGEEFIRNPNYLTMDEYLKYQGQQDEQAYWKRRLDALTLFNKKPQLPTMYKEGLFDRIFGGNTISVRPQGNVDVTFGGNWQNIKNPTLPARAQKFGIFDFDMQMNINLLATVGDKLKLNISNNTKATFDYQNIQKLEYTGKEDEIIKKIEAGSVSFPLNSSLISGVQSLFGIKTQLQFGKLWVTGVLSQQRSKRQSLTIQGGSQTQQFAIKADDYEENRHFLLGHYFRKNYNRALERYPLINSLVQINKIEVWVTNTTGATEGIRNVIAFMDLGEENPSNQLHRGAVRPIPSGLADNSQNNLYSQLLQNPLARNQGSNISAVQALGDSNGREFFPVTARKLNTSEFSFHPQLGYISLNTQLNPYDVLAVAYRYTYNGKVYQVGEFAEDLPPTNNTNQNSNDQRTLFLKLLKGTAPNPQLPVWDLMMKNVYALGGLGVSKEEFRLNVLYQDPGGGEKRYFPEGPKTGTLLLEMFNLDRLNFQNDPAPDGIFDFVEGITINTQQGKIMFPLLEPFGEDLKPALGGVPQLDKKYLYSILYDSTKTVARQFQQNNRYVIKGSYKSASSSEVFLGGFNIPQGSVSVSAGGQKLVENVDYQIDYGLGRLKILNSGILNSGIPISVQYEDNATFGFQTQNFIGTRLDYYFNNNLSIGSTLMRLTERPFTNKTTFGEDPIKNTVLGVDANYQSEFPALTRALDQLPLYSTTAPSFVNVTGEVAGLLPSHSKQINALDPEGSVYIDDFEGTRSSYDLKFPATAWKLASTPVGAIDKADRPILPEATASENLAYGKNRAKLAWYFLEPTLIDGNNGVPDHVKKDPNQHYIRLVQQQEVFPEKSTNALQNALSTFDLAFYPKERGPYNYDVARSAVSEGLLQNGALARPETRWGGIMRPIDNSDFEQANVEFIELWVMDPFINNPDATGGSLFINLGNVSEDVLKDERKFFENGIPYPAAQDKLIKTVWGYVPKFSNEITKAFETDPASRAIQDVGYDGLNNGAEQEHFSNYLSQAQTAVDPTAYQSINDDPSSDDFKYIYDYPAGTPVLERYKRFSNPQGNAPVESGTNTGLASGGTNVPESEDINRDNTLNVAEDYYQYRIDFTPDMQVGTNYIIDKKSTEVKLPNGAKEFETWYQIKIPIREYSHKVGNISDFRSIRFMRMFMHGFQDSAILRFARMELGRNNWRRYQFSLRDPQVVVPISDPDKTEFAVTSVSVEENAKRQPVPYVMPPGVSRQNAQVASAQTVQLNEQALALQVCNLEDGDARAVFKEVSVDMRQFSGLRMFIHAESRVGQQPLRDGDLRAIIRIGSDFTTNYYEYQIPLKVTPHGNSTADVIWPEDNRFDLILEDLVKVKTERNNKGLQSFIPYETLDSKGNIISILGNPNIGEAKTVMLGIRNPLKSAETPNDDGLVKCAEVWFNELRMIGLNEKPGYAAAGKVTIQLADLGNVNLSGSLHTQGYGNIDQKLNQRFRDDFYQYNASTNVNVGKLMPRKWGVQLPVFVGYSENISNPQYDPFDLDVTFKDKLDNARDQAQRDSLKKIAQDYTSITSFNVSNVRVLGNPEKASKTTMPWSVKNFDLNYAYNKQFKRNPIIESDELVNQRLGLGYTYNIKSRPVEPFKSLIRSKSKWLSLIKDFNFNPLPANVSVRSDLNRIVDETMVRNVSDAIVKIKPTFFKNFTWTRLYTMRWELARSLSFDYTATNNSRIDEPYGRIDTDEKRDTLIDRIKTFGRNTYYTQQFNASYNVPLQKLPITDWTSIRLTYGANYSWTAASLLTKELGNTIGNTQTKQVNTEFNFLQLYNKNRWLRAVNQAKPMGRNQPDKKADEKKVKDLRSAQRNNKPGSKADTTKPEVINTANLTDKQLDSLRKAIKAKEVAQTKAQKAKEKRDRKLARQKKRNTPMQVSDGERFAGRLLTMVRRSTVAFTENSGSVLPGYMDSTRYMGINDESMAPGLDFVYGYQPDRAWLETQSFKNRLSRDTLFNAQFQQQYSQNLNITTTVEPIVDLRADISFTRTFSKTHNELFKDTTHSGAFFTHNSPYETGAFTVSYIGLGTMFKPSDINSGVYAQFLKNREIVSERLGRNNPYSGGVPDPADPTYTKGYGRYSQDVLVPAFIAAYSGKSANDVALIDHNNDNVRSNPFKYYTPKPNWRVTYNGLSKLPMFNRYMNNLVVNHTYTGTLAMNSFVSALFYQDIFSVGFPSFLDSNSGNFVPFYQVPNITFSEQLNPMFGVDASFKNNLTARFDLRKTRTVSLSMVDYQVSETRSTEYVVGAGYRIRGLVLPFELFGVKKLDNDLNIKLDIGLRDDKTSNNYLAQNIVVTTRGQKVVTISPSIDYIISDKLTLRFFYDRRQSIPYTTNSFPITTTRAGVTLRFIFAQ